MKKLKTITACIALGAMMLCGNLSFAQSCAFLNEDYSPVLTWTTVHPVTACPCNVVTIASNKFNYNSCCDAEENRMYAPLGATLNNNDSWKADFDFEVNANSGSLTTYAPAHVLAGFTAGTLDTYNSVTTPCNGGTFPVTNQDAIAVIVSSTTTNGSRVIIGQSKDGNAAWSQSTGIAISSANAAATYYIRIQRLNAGNGLISVFTTAARTTHVAGSPQCFSITGTVTGLTHLQHGSIPQGGEQRKLYGQIDNMCVDRTSGISGPTLFCCPPGSVKNQTYTISIPTATYYCWAFPTGVTVVSWNNAEHSSVTVQFNCGTFVSPSNITADPVFGGTTCPGTSCGVSYSLSVSTDCSCCRIGNPDNSEIQVPQSRYSIYPNPSDGKIMIESAEEIQAVVITDITGRVVYTKNNFSASNLSVDLSKEPKGIYLVKIMQNGINRIEKITIE